MKQLVSLNNIGLAGLNSDVNPFELPIENITNGINFRVRNGGMAPMGSYQLKVDAPSLNQGNAGYLLHVRIAAGDYWVACSTNKILATDNVSGWWDATGEGNNYNIPDGGEFNWTGCQLGQMVTFNNPEISPVYILDINNGAILQDLPFSPTETWKDKNLFCRVMRSHKNFLIALGLKGSEQSPNGYRISHPADIDGYPFTWDETARDSIAIRAQLGSDGAEIIDGLSLRDSFVIYSRDSIDILDYNPGNEFYWSRRELSTTIGLLSTGGVVEVKGRHYFITDGDIMMNDGSNIDSIMHNVIQRQFNARSNEATRHLSFATKNTAMKEIWFCVPEGDSLLPNVAYIYNWKDRSWMVKDLPADMVYSDYGFSTAEDIESTGDTWANAIGGWETDEAPWGTEAITATNDMLAGVTQSGTLYDIDPHSDIDGDLNLYIERTDFPLLGHAKAYTVTRIYPHSSGDAFTFQFGSSQFVGGPVSWQAEQVFNPSEDRKLDFRSSGQLFAWRIKSIEKNRFRFSGFDVEFTAGGNR